MLVRTSKDKEHPYVLLNKTFLEDPNLSLKSKGLLAYCMCKPDGWKFHVDQMTTVLKEGRDALYSAFKELIKYGYCVRGQSREKGKFDKGEYILYEVPVKIKEDEVPPTSSEKPHTENPDTVPPDSEKTTLVNNDNSKNERSNINIAQTAPPLRKVAPQISFSFEERKFLHLDERDLLQWKETYPSIDINLEMKKMIEWCLSNEKKSKSKKLWRKFITNWLSNANEKAINQQAYRSNSPVKSAAPSGDPVENKRIADVIASSYVSKAWRIETLSKHVEFVPLGANCSTVDVIKYTEHGFKDQLESLLRKKQFVRKSA